MPWTFAHPAAALPFRRLGSFQMPLTGLVLGSLVPDLGYYIGRVDLATYAHSVNGIIFACLPVAFLLAFLVTRFHQCLIAPLPDPHRATLARLSPPPFWPLPQTARMAIAILVGAATHIAWDSFTHANGAVVLAIPSLRNDLFVFAGRPFAAYNILQHASTLLGLVVLAIVYRRWLGSVTKAKGRTERNSIRRYVPLAMAAALSLTLGLTIALLKASHEAPLSAVVVRGVIYSTVAFVAAYGALAVAACSTRQRGLN